MRPSAPCSARLTGVETGDDPSRDALSPNDPADLIKVAESAADDGDAKGRTAVKHPVKHSGAHSGKQDGAGRTRSRTRTRGTCRSSC